MKKSEIEIGGMYVARVSSKFTTVRVDAIRESFAINKDTGRIVYDVTNLTTGRKLTFRSAGKFRWPERKTLFGSHVTDCTTKTLCEGCYQSPCVCRPNDYNCDPQ